MGFTSRKGISFKSLFSVILCLSPHENDGEESAFKIYRSEHDIFTNLNYDKSARVTSSPSGTSVQCSSYGAECFDELCRYCRCLDGRNTFMISDAGKMKDCKRDEDIVPESVPNERFWLQNNAYNKCLIVETGSVIGTNCSSPTLDMLWIWTGKTNKRLMNVRTLECMEISDYANGHVFMRPCPEDDTYPQSGMTCKKQKKSRMKKYGWSRWIAWSLPKQSLHLKQDTGSKQYYAISSTRKSNQLWNSNETNICDSTETTYTGCYRFSDGSFMKYLNYSEMNPKLEISAPIFGENHYHDCTVSDTFKFIRHGEEWKKNTGKMFSIKNSEHSNHVIILEFATTEHFSTWNGSLLNISVVCAAEEHCVLLKLASLPTYSDEITNSSPSPFPKTTSTEKVATTVASELSRTTSTTKKQLESVKEETSESGGTNSAAIAVTVTLLLVALALALGYLVYYRRRKRAQVQQNNNNDIGVVNYSKEIYEDPDQTYETLDGVSPNQPGTTSDTYSYPDSNIIPNTTSSQQEYTYAKDTDFPRSSVSTKAAPEGPTSNGTVYETLEQPRQPTDNFYNYLDNTNIAKPPTSSELEYTYAKDTGLPRGSPNTKYETLKQPGQPSDDNFYNYIDHTNITKTPSRELEYTYAKDTDFPRSNPNTKVATQDPANRAVYHTLEQPSQPNDDDFYHYPDNTNITKPPSSELDYTYAKDTDFPRGNPGTMIAIQNPANRAVYHTLEQPGKPDDDDFYHYPDNTNITKTPSSELEYIYAKDTEIPRVIADKKAAPETTSNAVYHTLEHEPPTGTKIPTDLEYTYAKDTEIPKSFVNAPAASDALYQTPGQEAPTEPEYSYAKNTDMPSIQLRTKQTSINGHSSPLPDNSGMYHTLEGPNPPQAPVYSTLKGPEGVENDKQVTDERPNFSDHTYIDVIEDSNKTDSRNAKNSSSVA